MANLVFPAVAAEPAAGLQRDVPFTEVSPLSSNEELARRLMSSRASAAMRQDLQRRGKAVRDQPIIPSEERFALYVPPRMPQGGYGLLVFVPPWQQAKMPQGWADVLDRYGVIYVSAERSGNDEIMLARREPLALIAAINVLKRYKVDARHVFIGGFSGGSRVAERLAIGYPDLFHGALLNSGSDPIGTDDIPLPPRDLLHQLQAGTRVVFVTGENDRINLEMDRDAILSMRRFCLFSTDSEVMQSAGHTVIAANWLSRALTLLLQPPSPDRDKLDACRAGLENVDLDLDR